MFPNNVLQTAPSALHTSLDSLQYVIKLLLYIAFSHQKSRQSPYQVNIKMVVVPFFVGKDKTKVPTLPMQHQYKAVANNIVLLEQGKSYRSKIWPGTDINFTCAYT
mgnify:FL=1